MKLPTRLAGALGTLGAAILAYSTKLHLPAEVHTAILFVGGVLLAFLVDPKAAAIAGEQLAADVMPPTDGANVKPEAPSLPV